MEYNKYTLFEFEQDFPAELFLYKIGNIAYHFHSNIELIYVLEGDVEIISQDRLYALHEDDIYVCNAYSSHELHGQNAVILSLELDMEKLGVKKEERESIIFDCNSSLESDKSQFEKIKALISSFVKYNLKQQENRIYANLSMIYTLFAELLNKYRISSNTKINKTNKNLIKLNKIIEFINNNYQKGIGLKDISLHLNLTVPYLSSFFEKNMGKKFQDYYDELRINKSMVSLVTTDIPINILSVEYGFQDSRGYVRAFKKIHNLTPTEYRMNLSKVKKSDSIFESEFKKTKYLDKLLKDYNPSYQLNVKIHKNSIIQEINCDYESQTKLIKKPWLNSFSVGHASNFLNYSIREMIDEIQKDIKFKYVSFSGILDDSMHIIRKYDNEIRYSFIFVDQIFDYILSLGLKPIVQLSYIPKILADDKSIQYENGIIIGQPKKNSEYILLIENLVTHLIQRYGINHVKNWVFTFWNAPDTTKRAYGFENDDDFFNLYSLVYNKLKEIDKDLIVASPSLIPLCNETFEWDSKFLKYAYEHNVYPDILIIHYYSNDFSSFFNNTRINERLINNPDNMSLILNKIKSKDFYSGNKIFITEFNFTVSRRNLLSDTVYTSSFIAKNILENYDKVDGFGKLGLTDLADETIVPNKVFHGGPGFFTYNGIKKPSYYTYKFLSKLTNELLQNDKGYFITKGKDELRIMLYNYEHYSPLYASGDYFDLKDNERYSPFDNNKIIHYNLCFNNLKYKKAIIKQYKIGKDSASAYDIAASIGLTDEYTIEEINDLKAFSTPNFRIYEKDIIDNVLKFEINVDSLEIKYIEIKFK